MSEVLTDNWAGCYREGWGQNRLRPASFAHPAKNSYGLSVRIYEHALAEGWVKAGDYIVDCFSGIGGFALEAMRNGLHFVGCELEQRFVDMGQGCDCTGISKADWARYQGRWDRMRYEGGRHWCPECLMKAGAVADVREFKPLPLPGTKWAALAKTHQATLFDAAPTASYVRNSGKIPCTGAHRYHGNIETWEAQGMPGSALIVQGDSRRLGEVLERARCCISSPPWGATRDVGTTDWMAREKAAGRLPSGTGGDATKHNNANMLKPEHPANLGNLPDTGFEAALAEQGHTVAPEKPGNTVAGEQAMPAASQDVLAALPEGDHAEALRPPAFFHDMESLITALDRTPGGPLDGDGDAEALEAGAVTGRAQACISSPPWTGAQPGANEREGMRNAELAQQRGDLWGHYAESRVSLRNEYKYMSPEWLEHRKKTARSQNLSRLPETAKDPDYPTFWAASRTILEQVYQVLAPGGHAIFVCKRFVRNKAIVDFPLQWARLCEAVGFTWIHHHKAWLVEDRGAQHTLDGGLEKREVRRLSFFRRLHTQKYPHLAILWEDVLCFVKE